jgi:hypothetical protein
VGYCCTWSHLVTDTHTCARARTHTIVRVPLD